MVCRTHLGEVQRIHADLSALGATVVAVSLTPAKTAAAYLAKYPFPFEVASDPTLRAYETFGLGRATLLAMARPRLVFRFLMKVITGTLPHIPLIGDDVLRLGGDFVLDRGRRLAFAHRSRDPGDNASPEQLLEAVRAVP